MNIDDGAALLNFRLPSGGSEAVDLQTGEPVSVENGQLSLQLEGCESKILKIVG